MPERAIVEVVDRAAWRRWLMRDHARGAGVWLNLLWMAPRKPRSVWSAVNKRRVEALLADGLITDAGLVVIEAAKEDGSWQALERSDSLEVPDDLQDAFDRHAGSCAHWDGFPPGVRKQILQWIYTARREGTRAIARRGDGEPGGQRRARAPVAPQGLSPQRPAASPNRSSNTWAQPGP